MSTLIPQQVKDSFRPILDALAPARTQLNANPDVVLVRPGYDDAGKPAVSVAVLPGTQSVDAAALAGKLQVPVVVLDATVEEQLAVLFPDKKTSRFAPSGQAPNAFESLLQPAAAPVAALAPRSGTYKPMAPPRLDAVKADHLTVSVSPEGGWTTLGDFLRATKERLTVAMYQFTAPHVWEAINSTLEPAPHAMQLVLHPRPEAPPKSGVKSHDWEEGDVTGQLHVNLKTRFHMAWASVGGGDGLWASAYHIKVAVRDGKTVWLSSGNWQSSNQPDVTPQPDGKGGFLADGLPAGFQRNYNRDYHAVVQHQKLAEAFEAYIRYDFEQSGEKGLLQYAHNAAEHEPDVFVPEEEAAPAPVKKQRLFAPREFPGPVDIQPLLTPDNYAPAVVDLIESAKKKVWFQNQYINFKDDGQDFPLFKALVLALKKKIDEGRDVRIICRDMMAQESVDILTAIGFPRDRLRFQPACHNKCILIDDDRVMFGSHNWSNEGVLTNRDAGLIITHPGVNAFLSEVYAYDWEQLANAHPAPKRPRVARSKSEKAPPGMKRERLSRVVED